MVVCRCNSPKNARCRAGSAAGSFARLGRAVSSAASEAAAKILVLMAHPPTILRDQKARPGGGQAEGWTVPFSGMRVGSDREADATAAAGLGVRVADPELGAGQFIDEIDLRALE